MFLALPDQSEATNRQNLPRSINRWHQIGLGGPGTDLKDTFTNKFDLILNEINRIQIDLTKIGTS